MDGASISGSSGQTVITRTKTSENLCVRIAGGGRPKATLTAASVFEVGHSTGNPYLWGAVSTYQYSESKTSIVGISGRRHLRSNCCLWLRGTIEPTSEFAFLQFVATTGGPEGVNQEIFFFSSLWSYNICDIERSGRVGAAQVARLLHHLHHYRCVAVATIVLVVIILSECVCTTMHAKTSHNNNGAMARQLRPSTDLFLLTSITSL